MTKSLVKIPLERVEEIILLIRGEKVILDTDLAALYGVETRALIQAVKRNRERFPVDFTFQLTLGEAGSLRSQFVISKGRGGRRYVPVEQLTTTTTGPLNESILNKNSN